VPASERNDHARHAAAVAHNRSNALENKARIALTTQPAASVKCGKMSPPHDIRRHPRCEK
jgi:hypothetical protein